MNTFYEMMVGKTTERLNAHFKSLDLEIGQKKNSTQNSYLKNEADRLKKEKKLSIEDLKRFYKIYQEIKKNNSKISSLLRSNSKKIRDLRFFDKTIKYNIKEPMKLYEEFVFKYEATLEDVVGLSRQGELNLVRACIIKHLRELDFTFQEIGKMFNRHHSTILHLHKRDMQYDKKFEKAYKTMLECIKELEWQLKI